MQKRSVVEMWPVYEMWPVWIIQSAISKKKCLTYLYTKLPTTTMQGNFTYILLCEGNNLYTGSTKDIRRRFEQHISGNGANFTRKHPPLRIVYLELHERIDHAFYREKQIQRWSRSKKEALIRGDTNELKRLSICLNESNYKNYTKWDMEPGRLSTTLEALVRNRGSDFGYLEFMLEHRA